MTKNIKDEIIEQCINWTGIEDGHTCLDRGGARDLSNDVFEQSQKLIYKTLKPLIDEIYTKNSMDRIERSRLHKLLSELAKVCGEKE